MPPATAAVAASTADEVTDAPDRSEPMMNTSAGAHRGWMCSPVTSGEPISSASPAARKPYSGSLTPTCACLARDVRPSFQPASGPASPRSRRCTSYAAARSKPSSSADSEPIAVRSALAFASRAATSGASIAITSHPLLDDADSDGTEAVEVGAEHVSGRHRHRGVQRPGHDQVPGLQLGAHLAEGVGQP